MASRSSGSQVKAARSSARFTRYTVLEPTDAWILTLAMWVQTPEVGKRVGRTLVAATSVPGHPDRLLVLRDSHVSCLLSLISFLSSPVSCPVFCIPSPVSCRTSPVSRLLAVSHLLSHISCLTSPVLRPLSIFSSLPCCKCYTTPFALSSKSILLLWCYRINFNDLGI